MIKHVSWVFSFWHSLVPFEADSELEVLQYYSECVLESISTSVTVAVVPLVESLIAKAVCVGSFSALE